MHVTYGFVSYRGDATRSKLEDILQCSDEKQRKTVQVIPEKRARDGRGTKMSQLREIRKTLVSNARLPNNQNAFETARQQPTRTGVTVSFINEYSHGYPPAQSVLCRRQTKHIGSRRFAKACFAHYRYIQYVLACERPVQKYITTTKTCDVRVFIFIQKNSYQGKTWEYVNNRISAKKKGLSF